MNESPNLISRQAFNKMPKGIGENNVLKFFENNKDAAFKEDYLEKQTGYAHSRLYAILRNLVAIGLIEKRGEYYAFKEDGTK